MSKVVTTAQLIPVLEQARRGKQRIVFNAKTEEMRREAMLRELRQRIREVRQGPDELLVGARVELDHELSFPEVAEVVHRIERNVRRAVPIA